MGQGTYNGGSTIIRCHPVGVRLRRPTLRTATQIENEIARDRKKAELENARSRAKARRSAAKRSLKRASRKRAKAESKVLSVTVEKVRNKEQLQRERARKAAKNVVVEHRKRRDVKVPKHTKRDESALG